jgi:hypothetical protein
MTKIFDYILSESKNENESKNESKNENKNENKNNKEKIIFTKPNEFIIGAHDINSLKYYKPNEEQSIDVPDIILKYYFVLDESTSLSSKLIKLEQLEHQKFKIKFDLSDLPEYAKSVKIIIQTDKKEEKLFLFFDGVKNEDGNLNDKLHKLFENIIPTDAYFFANIKKDSFGVWSIIEIINYGEH